MISAVLEDAFRRCLDLAPRGQLRCPEIIVSLRLSISPSIAQIGLPSSSLFSLVRLHRLESFISSNVRTGPYWCACTEPICAGVDPLASEILVLCATMPMSARLIVGKVRTANTHTHTPTHTHTHTNKQTHTCNTNE
jgi:hypothetical protein